MVSETDRPNILFICVDQWRADCLGFTGHPVVETPHLDRLSQESINFSQAYSSSPTCIAARAAIFTGLTQRHHGFVGYRDGVEWDYDVTLPGLLAQGGYHTQCVGKMHVNPPRNMLGFHNVVLHDGYMHFERMKKADYSLIDDYTPWLQNKVGRQEADYIDTGLGCNGYAARPWVYDEMLHPTTWVTTQGIDFLRRRDPTKPFFLMLSYHRPHPPLDPPAFFLDRYMSKELPEIPMGDWVDYEIGNHSFDSPVPRGKAQIDLARRAYYAQISHIDYQINRMLMGLFESGQWGNTAIMFTSDHGDMLYDHNMIAKSVPFDGSARVPFLLRLPMDYLSQGYRANTTIDHLVELRDILPTFCDLAGIGLPDTVDGNTILPLCRGEAESWREYIHGEHIIGDKSNQWITDGKEKYVWFTQTGRELLLDIVNDPQELHDLSKRKPDRIKYWRSILIQELEGREEGFVQDDDLVVGCRQRPTLQNPGTRQDR